jgi:dihydroneopterin aldolase
MVNAAKISGASAFLRQILLIDVDIDSAETAAGTYDLILQTVSYVKREKIASGILMDRDNRSFGIEQSADLLKSLSRSMP